MGPQAVFFEHPALKAIKSPLIGLVGTPPTVPELRQAERFVKKPVYN